MNENYINENKIDSEHKIESVINDCKVTICFSKNRNNHVERNVLENLLDTFENRMKAQIGCWISFNLFFDFAGYYKNYVVLLVCKNRDKYRV